MKWILPMNEPFKNLKEYTSVHSQSLALNACSTDSKVDLANTNEDQIQGHRLDQFRRLHKKSAKKWEISFQKHFLAEHTTTFRKQLQNFLEYGLGRLKGQNSKRVEALRRDYLQADTTVTVATLLQKERIPTSSIHLHHFSACRPELEDLENFLDQMLLHCNQFLARELIALSIQLWIQFRNDDFQFLERKELIQKSNAWVATHSRRAYQRDDFTYLNWKVGADENLGGQTQMPKAFVRFLGYFSSTVLLILAGFFQNPYLDTNFDPDSETVANYPKRQLTFFGDQFWSNQSDFSDSEESFPMKKHRKYS